MSTRLKKLIEIMVKRAISESNLEKQYEPERAKKYVDDMIKRHKTSKQVRQAILDNLVNSPYQSASNSYIEAVWSEFKKRFPS